YAVEHIQQWMRTERYLKWKQVLKEFGLWKRLPLIVLAFSLIYLTLLQDGLTLIGSLPIPLFRIVYSEEQLWIEAKPLDEIGRIAKFAPLESQQLWDILRFKNNALEEYKKAKPEQFRSNVEWLEKDFASHLQKFHLSGMFLGITVFLLLTIRKSSTFQW